MNYKPLDQILPDDSISEYIYLGNQNTSNAWRIADKMITDWFQVIEKVPDYPIAQFYKEIAQWLGGKSVKQVQNYYRTGEEFPPSKRDDNIGFTIHTYCLKFDDPHEILKVASRQTGILGKCPTLDWLKSAVSTEEKRIETKVIQDVTEAVVASAFHFINKFTLFLNKLCEALEPDKRDRVRELMTEILEIISEEEQ